MFHSRLQSIAHLAHHVTRRRSVLRAVPVLVNGCMQDGMCLNGIVRSRYFHESLPAQSVRDKLRSVYDYAREGADSRQERLLFDEQMALFSDKENPIDGDRFLIFLDRMKSVMGLKGFRQNLPWVQNNPALKEIQDQEAIIGNLTPEERRKVAALTISVKKRISRSTGQSIDVVEALLGQIATMRQIQEWLVRRSAQGILPPESMRELQAAISDPTHGIPQRATQDPSMPKFRPGVKQKRRR